MKNKKTEVGETMGSSRKQNKSITLYNVTEVTSFGTNLPLRGQLHWAWPKRKIESLISLQKSIGIQFFGLNTF